METTVRSAGQELFRTAVVLASRAGQPGRRPHWRAGAGSPGGRAVEIACPDDARSPGSSEGSYPELPKRQVSGEKRGTERESPYLQTNARAETRADCRARGSGCRGLVAGRCRGWRDRRVGRAGPGRAGSGRVHRAGAAQRHPASEQANPAKRHRGQPQPGIRAASDLPRDRLRRHTPSGEGLVHPGGRLHPGRRGRPGRELRAQAGQHGHLLPGVRADRPPDQPARRSRTISARPRSASRARRTSVRPGSRSPGRTGSRWPSSSPAR